ncbi:MAG: GGDEF domain-containing protein [Mycobacteriales bacterium]|nr:GGDEF domain-containing protein [Mycobacteriales bacterium]
MGWTSTVVLNVIITGCYLVISGLIFRGLVRTGQLRSNPLALATSLIFLSCAVHHGHHALHVWEGGGEVKATFGTWHSVSVDVFGAGIAVLYLSLRRRYGALLNTPSMFEDQVSAETERRLRQAAYRDQLTGLANRTAFTEAAQALDASPGLRLAVGYVDLDGFKPVNDRYGHDAGDAVLREVGARLAAALLPHESVYRLGGDEFVVLSPDHVGRLTDTAARVRAAVNQRIEVPDDETVHLGCSVGMARGVTGTDLVEDLLRRADAAMYLAKRRGSGVAVFDESSWLVSAPTQRLPTSEQVERTSS